MEDIQIATVQKCELCNGNGCFNNHAWDTCLHCGGTGKLIGNSISIKELKRLIKLENTKEDEKN